MINEKSNYITPNHRVAIWEKYNGRCIFCETKEKLQFHHINTKRTDNRLKNLLLVCKYCHLKCHGRYNLEPYINEIIRLRRAGYTYGMVGDSLGLPRTVVGGVISREQRKDPTIAKENWKNFNKYMNGEIDLPIDKTL